MSDTATPAQTSHADDGKTRRDFLYLAGGAMGVVGTAIAVWPFVNSMNPSAEVLALATTEVDLSPVELGQSITVIWQGQPIFIRRRPQAEIDEARAVALDDLPHRESDEDRTQKAEWLVMVGVCTHLGCVPKGQRAGDPKGEYGGWLCPCHGSHYDTSGRIRKGPAPENLPVPPYEFLDDTTILIG
jgi:ubiquinol-cytochrome c reductase iron-sulfur subunit